MHLRKYSPQMGEFSHDPRGSSLNVQPDDESHAECLTNIEIWITEQVNRLSYNRLTPTIDNPGRFT
jgi:hypothetical protein